MLLRGTIMDFMVSKLAYYCVTHDTASYAVRLTARSMNRKTILDRYDSITLIQSAISNAVRSYIFLLKEQNCGPEKDLRHTFKHRADLSPLAPDASGKLNVLGHDSNTLSVDGTQVSILEETHQISFASLLKGHHS